MKTKHLIVVRDDNSGREAIYLDGELVFECADVYACDIAEQCQGIAINFSHVVVHKPDIEAYPYTEEFPQQFDKCMLWVVDEELIGRILSGEA